MKIWRWNINCYCCHIAHLLSRCCCCFCHRMYMEKKISFCVKNKLNFLILSERMRKKMPFMWKDFRICSSTTHSFRRSMLKAESMKSLKIEWRDAFYVLDHNDDDENLIFGYMPRVFPSVRFSFRAYYIHLT